MSEPDSIGQFTRISFTAFGKPLYAGGEGPPVILIHELNGMTDQVLTFATRLSASFTVCLPILFGAIPVTTRQEKRAATRALCVSKEINTFRTGRTSPVVSELRALATAVSTAEPGNVGVVGMCMSGGFALALASSRPVRAAVASQPSLPAAITPWHARDLGLSPQDVNEISRRMMANEVEIFYTRFSGDLISPPGRLKAAKQRLGPDGLHFDVIPSGFGSGYGFGCFAHSVLTVEASRHPSGPAHERLEETARRVESFLHERIRQP